MERLSDPMSAYRTFSAADSIATPRSASKRRMRRKQIKADWQLYVLILPAVISVLIFHYIPIYGIQIAFKDFRSSMGIWGSPWVGLEHFKRFVTYKDFWTIVTNTVTISLYSIAMFPISPIFALMLNELDNLRFKKTVQMITYAPHFVSTVVVCAMVLLFLDRSNGLINNIIAALGGERVSFISVPEYFSTIYVLSGEWKDLGWGTIIYMAALSSISPELIEAAKIDGASRFQIVRYINVPSILPTIITLLILRTGTVLSVGFEKIYLLQNSLNLPKSRVISTYVYEIGLRGGQFSYSTAIGLFNSVIEILFIMFVNKLAKTFSETSLW